jgi:hypothetical protein
VATVSETAAVTNIPARVRLLKGPIESGTLDGTHHPEPDRLIAAGTGAGHDQGAEDDPGRSSTVHLQR